MWGRNLMKQSLLHIEIWEANSDKNLYMIPRSAYNNAFKYFKFYNISPQKCFYKIHPERKRSNPCKFQTHSPQIACLCSNWQSNLESYQNTCMYRLKLLIKGHFHSVCLQKVHHIMEVFLFSLKEVSSTLQ